MAAHQAAFGLYRARGERSPTGNLHRSGHTINHCLLAYCTASSIALASHQQSHNRGREKICHGPGNHGAEAQLGEVLATFRSQSPNAADLDANRAEVGKAAQSKWSNGHRAWIERGFLRS